jgi:hypothetical protein
MDELERLSRLKITPPAPDLGARTRMRATLDLEIAAAPSAAPRGSRGRRRTTIALLVAAAVSMGGLAAAAATGHLWSQGDPVAITPPPDNVHGEEVSLGVPNENARLTSVGDFEAAVAEFAPRFHLPAGHDFSRWQIQVEAVSGDFGDWRRGNVASGMVVVATCQWDQRWLDQVDAGDTADAKDSLSVLGEIIDWSDRAGLSADNFDERMLDGMADGETATVRSYVAINCGGTGAATGTTAELDAIAQARIDDALAVAREYADANGSYVGLNPAAALNLDPETAWVGLDSYPTASPGLVHVESSSDGTVFIATQSDADAATVFCLTDDGSGPSVEGTTDIRYGHETSGDAPVCTPGGWESPG